MRYCWYYFSNRTEPKQHFPGLPQTQQFSLKGNTAHCIRILMIRQTNPMLIICSGRVFNRHPEEEVKREFIFIHLR